MPAPQGRSVLITGASKGIGAATALRLDAMGFRVFAGVRRDEDGHTLAAQASARLTPILLDVMRTDQITRAAETVARDTDGRGLFGLVNNAGIVVGGPLEFIPLDEIRRQFEVNVVGVIAVTQTFLPLVRAAAGRIVNIGSVSGRVASPFVGPYAASKFALEGLSDSWRVELARWGIDVVLIEPGAHRTDIWKTSFARAMHMAERYPPRAQELYGGILRSAGDRLGDAPRRASSPDRVARVVGRALTARHPRARYPVGLDAWVGATIAQLIPTWLRDRLLRR